MELQSSQEPYECIQHLYQDNGVPIGDDEEARFKQFRFLSERMMVTDDATLSELEIQFLKEKGFDYL